MSLTEPKRANKMDILAEMNKIAYNRYREKSFGRFRCFVSASGVPFNIFAFPGENAICVEYAENESDAALGRFEDGDRFYLEDFRSLEELSNAVFAEVDS